MPPTFSVVRLTTVTRSESRSPEVSTWRGVVSRVNKRLFWCYSNYHNVWEKGEVLTLTEAK